MAEDDSSKKTENTWNVIIDSTAKKSSWGQDGLTVIALVALGYFLFARSEDGEKPDAAQLAAAIAEPVQRATLTITSAGMKERNVLHDPDSPFFGEHELQLRKIIRSEGYEWLPAHEAQIGCVPCFNALTFVAVIDGNAYAINGSTRTWARQMMISIDESAPSPILDPYAEDGPAAPTEHGNPMAMSFSRLIQEIQDVPGCRMTGAAQGSLERTANAVTRGVCLPGE